VSPRPDAAAKHEAPTAMAEINREMIAQRLDPSSIAIHVRSEDEGLIAIVTPGSLNDLDEMP
jgi:hypothetical protein